MPVISSCVWVVSNTRNFEGCIITGNRGTCAMIWFSKCPPQEKTNCNTVCGGKLAVAHYFLAWTGWISRSQCGSWPGWKDKVCYQYIFKWLHVRFKGFCITYGTSLSDVLKYSYICNIIHSSFGKENIFVMEKNIWNRNSIACTDLFSSTIHILFITVL